MCPLKWDCKKLCEQTSVQQVNVSKKTDVFDSFTNSTKPIDVENDIVNIILKSLPLSIPSGVLLLSPIRLIICTTPEPLFW